MAVFDMAQHVVSGAAGVIGGSTEIDVAAALASMQDGLDACLLYTSYFLQIFFNYRFKVGYQNSMATTQAFLFLAIGRTRCV